ncbi:hypothetical protein ORV05_13080 [Amycolatopsis cynarae]|uniref:Transferase n=1 Tax=Amycolatopsis cynarae TaxID=2995223 RepID=A0ABY7BB67_9PSEU|nr:hypothetical protein [Amycolatopsis sp. HUAS 11-8]WAL68664.1 hypothetical protein ORV05_13080 [Amycolatopsis sp. HUAS 11-8]
MSSGLRASARLITATAVVTAYVALHLVITAGLDLRARDRVGSTGGDQAALEHDLGLSATLAMWCAVATGVFVVAALWLRHRRRAGVAEIVEVVGRIAPSQPWWRRPVFLAASGAGYGLFAAGFVAVSTAQSRGYQLPLATQVFLLPTGLAVLGAGLLILRFSRPRSVRDAVRALLADGRRPVLYLRSFADDQTAARVDDGANLNIHSREEQLAQVLRAFGPVIAVGKPGEPLPHLGAARFYLPYDDWQPAVLRLMELSQLIVLHLGPGEGLWWEVEQVIATQPEHKLVLLAPGRPADVAGRLDELLPTPSRLTEVAAAVPWISAVVAFGPDWTPHVYPVEPASAAPRGGLARRAFKAASAPLLVITPARRVARAVKAALAAAGVRRRMLVLRSEAGMLVTLGKGLLVLAALALPYRALQLFGIG